MTLRAPLYSRPNRRAYQAELLTWTDGLPPGVIALTIPAGQKQRDWPNPVIARPNLELRTWVEGLPQTALAFTVPPRQADWPNPQPQRQNLALRTWTYSQQLQPAAGSPFNQLNWPNPPGLKANLELRTWTDGLPQLALALTLPPRQQVWPNPAQSRPNLALRTWALAGQLQAAAGKPFAQYEWPNPVIGLKLRQDWTAPNLLTLKSVAPVMPPMARTWIVPPPKVRDYSGWAFSTPIDFYPAQAPEPGPRRETFTIRRVDREADAARRHGGIWYQGTLIWTADGWGGYVLIIDASGWPHTGAPWTADGWVGNYAYSGAAGDGMSRVDREADVPRIERVLSAKRRDRLQ